jgi:hypothetical protein
MTKKNTLLLLFSMFILSVCAFLGVKIFVIDKQIPIYAGMRVDTTPKSKVFLNGQFVSDTPFEKEDLIPGEYIVRVEPLDKTTGIQSWEGKVKLFSGSLTYINETLASDPILAGSQILWLEKIPSASDGELTIVSTPDKGRVYLDGQEKGQAPILLRDIGPGDHEIRVSLEEYSDQIVQGKILPGYRLNAIIKLNKSKIAKKDKPISIEPVIPVAVLGSASQSATISKPYVVIKETPTGFLRVRSAPNLVASEAAKVRPGEQFPLISEIAGWSQIKIGDDVGWANDQYLDKVK